VYPTAGDKRHSYLSEILDWIFVVGKGPVLLLSLPPVMLHRTATTRRTTGGGALLLSSSGGRNSSTRPQQQHTTTSSSKVLLVVGLLIGIIGLVSIYLSSHVTGVATTTTHEDEDEDMPISIAPNLEEEISPEERHRRLTTSDFYTQFPSLRPILSEYVVVGLYFAAAWCPMSTTVTELLHDTFAATMLMMMTTTDTASSDQNDPEKSSPQKPFALVYISSDVSVVQFDGYRKPWWHYIPYDQAEERRSIKQYLRTCARKEMEGLNITAPRDAEIPHLDILRHGVLLTRAGITDVRARGSTAIAYWLTAPPHDLHVTMSQ
jgi:Thioredoxin-like